MTQIPSTGFYLTLHLPMSEPRTITGYDSSKRQDQISLEVEGTLNHRFRILSTVRWYLGRLELLTGAATLGVAAGILMLSGRKRESGNSEASFKVIPLILAALSLLFLTPTRRKYARSSR